jgi:hypothetical protein
MRMKLQNARSEEIAQLVHRTRLIVVLEELLYLLKNDVSDDFNTEDRSDLIVYSEHGIIAYYCIQVT